MEFKTKNTRILVFAIRIAIQCDHLLGFIISESGHWANVKSGICTYFDHPGPAACWERGWLYNLNDHILVKKSELPKLSLLSYSSYGQYITLYPLYDHLQELTKVNLILSSPFSSPHLWLWSTRDSEHTQHIPDPLLCYSTCICRVSFSVMRRVLKVHGADIIWHPLVGLSEFLTIPVHKKVHPAFSFKISVT
jgi:hypothetical protein